MVHSRLHRVALAVSFLASAVLTGCAGFSTTASPVASSIASVTGTARGGQQPLSGASVYLFAAGKTGYGSASSSLLNGALTGHIDAAGNAYVVSDAGGNWSITGDYVACTPTDQLYVLVTGGNPGLSGNVNNSAIAMMSALGSCSSINSSTFVIVNELSTVAAVHSLAQFMTDGTHIGSTSTNALGLRNAFSTVGNLVGLAETAARVTTPAGNGTVPRATLHTLSNAMAACVNTAASTSTACASFLSASTPAGGTLSPDTLVGMLNIARNPGNNVQTLYNLSTTNPPFLPALTAKPNDFSLGITYALGGVPEPGFLAIDAAGNVFATNRASEKSPYTAADSIVKLSPLGAVLSGTGFTANGAVSLPEGIAVDLDGSSLWIASTPSDVIKISGTGSTFAGFPAYSGSYPQGIAVDTGGNAWVSNSQSGTTSQIAANGTLLRSGIAATNFTYAQGVAIDYNANIYVVGQGSSSIEKISPSGTLLSSGSGFTGAGLNAPSGISIDNASRLWVVNTQFGQNGQTAPSNLSVLTSSGGAVTGSAGYGNASAGYANIPAVDGAGATFTALCTTLCTGSSAPNILLKVSSTGTVLSPANGFQNASFSAPQGIAIDASGNLWVANSGGQYNATPGTITQMIGIAAPIKTPIVQQLTGLNLLGVRP